MKAEEFTLKKEIDLCTAWIAHDIRSPRRRKQVREEYAAHLDDATYHHMMEGHSEEEAFLMAKNELGDAKNLQRTLGIVHNKATSKFLRKLGMVLAIAVTAVLPPVISGLPISYSLQSWMILSAQLICIALSLLFVITEYKFVRALAKRISLIQKIKRICLEKGYRLYCTAKAYTEWDGASNVPAMVIETGEKTYAVRFIACLKRHDTYTFTDVNSYYTATNFNPILWSNNYPVSLVTVPGRWLLPRFATAKNEYLKEEVTRLPAETLDLSGAEKILCIHPISVKVQVVHTNRGEDIFDGDTFKGHTVYSGKGLCEVLKK